MTYEIHYSNGTKTTRIESYDDAKAEVRRQYPGAEIGHDGDLGGFGDRTLCWATEEDAVDDDGANAVASIVRVQND